MKYDYNKQIAFLNDFVNRLSIERNLSKSTLNAYKGDITRFINWLAMRKYEEISSSSIYEYFLYLQNAMKLSPKSIRRKYVSINQYCNFLRTETNANENFFHFSSRKYQIPHTLPKTLSLEEIKKLICSTNQAFENATSDYKRRLCIRDMCIIEFLFCLGLRIGEMSALNIDDYNREEHSLLIHGKGNKERLMFISSPVVVQKLHTWLVTRTELNPKDSALFINKYGKRLSIYSIENIFYKYRNISKINPSATPHFMRHSFATQLLNHGAGIRDVQELLGHNSIVTTQIYTEISMTRKKEVLSKYNGRNFINPN